MKSLHTIATAHVARWLLFAGVAMALSAGIAAAQTFTPRDESPEDYPVGAGRDETFYACTACHGFKLVAAQGQNRRQWDDTINWMSEKHGMPKLEAKERDIVLNYLEAAFPPRAPSGGGGFQNPFMKR
jgi:mono/diheme cytochrome c family protein